MSKLDLRYLMRPAVVFIRNHAARNCIRKIQHPMPLKASAKSNGSGLIKHGSATNGLAQIIT